MSQDILIDDKVYAVVHTFSDDRCIILFDGTYAMADRVGGDWMLGGPATGDERAVLKELIGPDQTTVTVTRTPE